MIQNKGKGVKRNEERISDERPTKTVRIEAEGEAQAPDEIPGQGQPQLIPSNCIRRRYGKMESLGITRISMDFEGEIGHELKQSFIESIQSCPTDLDLICSDGVAFAHRFILMGVSSFFFQLLRDRDMKDTEAITLLNVSIKHLLLVLDLIYSGDTIVKESDEDALHEVLDSFGMKLRLERKEVTKEDLAVNNLEQAEDPINVVDVSSHSKIQNVEKIDENGETSGSSAETAKASKNNANTSEELDAIDNFGIPTDSETETGVVEASAYHQVYRAEAYSQPQQMEAEESDSEVEESDVDSDNQIEVDKENDSLPFDSDDDDDDDDNETGKDASDNDGKAKDDCGLRDRTSDYEEEVDNLNRNDSDGEAELERRSGNPMTVAESRPGQFDLREPNPSEGHITWNGKKIRWHLMEALPSLTSPELRSERMRVFTLKITKMGRFSLPNELLSLFNSLPENSLEKRLGMMAVKCESYKEIDLVKLVRPREPHCYDIFFNIHDIELVGTPGECANVVQTLCFYENKSSSSQAVALKSKMMSNESALYNLENYKKIIYENVPIKEDKLLEISNIEGLEDRANAMIKINVAGRTVKFSRIPDTDRWPEAFGYRSEIGIGWNVWRCGHLEWYACNYNLTGIQILFPTLAKDIDLAEGQIKKLSPSSYYNNMPVAVSPKCLLENGISCFPVIQKPGMLIYKYNSTNLRWVRDISKLRLGMGADKTL